MTDIAQFVSSIGINTHVDATGTAYGNIELVQASLAYVGISFIRDHAYGIDLAAYTALVNAGVSLDLILDDDPKAEIDSLITLALAIRTFEGPNEVDYQPILTNNIADPVLAAVTEQQSVQAAIRETASVSTVPLIAESVADPGSLLPTRPISSMPISLTCMRMRSRANLPALFWPAIWPSPERCLTNPSRSPRPAISPSPMTKTASTRPSKPS